MSNLKKVNSIYDDILSKVKYDSLNERYYVDVFDYVFYSFGKKQYALLMDECKKRNIYLDVIPKVLYYKETEELFRKLKYFKNQFDSDKYEKEINDLRLKIFEGYQILILRLIVINFPNVKDSIYRDDIIQLGYMYLIRAIDNFDLDKGVSFDWYLCNYISNNVFRDIRYIDKGMISNKDLIKLVDVREKLEDKADMDKLASETGFDKNRIYELLSLEKLMNADSVEYIKEILYDDEEVDYRGILVDVDDSLEEVISSELFREKIFKLVNTLPNEMQRNIVIRYYGIDGEAAENITQIKDCLGMTRQGVQNHLSNGISNLKHPLRLKYLKELVKGYTDFEFLDNFFDADDSDIEKYKYEELELFLLKELPRDELISLVSLIDFKNREALLIYLGINNVGASFDDITKDLGVSFNTYLDRRKRGLISLRKLINEKYIIGNENKDINDSMDYLMYRYLNGSKKRVRCR